MIPWDELRLNQVKESARQCPDACAVDVISLIDELRKTRQALATMSQTAALNGQEMLRAQGRAERAEADAEDAEDRYNDLLSKIGGTL